MQIRRTSAYVSNDLQLRNRRTGESVPRNTSTSRHNDGTFEAEERTPLLPENSSDTPQRNKDEINYIGERIFEMVIPYKYDHDVDTTVIDDGHRYGGKAVTKRPLVGHHLADARLRLVNGGAFMQIKDNPKAKELKLTVFDPKECAHPLVHGQRLTQDDMKYISTAARAIAIMVYSSSSPLTPKVDIVRMAEHWVKYKRQLPDK